MADGPQRRLAFPALFICDIQEKFRSAIFEFDKVVLTAEKLIKAATILQIPTFVTTQSRAKLGPTVAELTALLPSANVCADEDKTRFSMWTGAVPQSLANKSHAVAIVGIEAHICVTQTALDLLQRGHTPYIIVDGVSSVRREDTAVALQRLRAAGALVTSSEGFLYEVMGDAAIPEFKAVVELVKATKESTTASLSALGPKM